MILKLGLLCFLFGCGTERESSESILRVGTSGDYEPFSFDDESGQLAGFEIEMALRFAADHGLKVKFVRFRWPDLLSDLKADKFDVVMSGVTVREDRSLAGRFSLPIATSGAVVIVPPFSPIHSVEELNLDGVRIGVNAGGHLEQVTRATFFHATIVTSTDNQAVPDLLLNDEIDALVTDTLESSHWLKRLPGARALPPFTQDRKAWLVQPENESLARQLDKWLLECESDRILSRLRKSYLLSNNDTETAEPLYALLAAMDERLSLMPAVAESKRTQNRPVEDLEQEALVLQAAAEGVRAEAVRQGRSPPSESAVVDYFKAQIEAAKVIQYKVLAQSTSMEDPPDLVTEIRPALGRISERINRLILELSAGVDVQSIDSIRSQVEQALTHHDLPAEHLNGLSVAIDLLINP